MKTRVISTARLFLAVMILMLATHPAQAQESRGAILGQVTDPGGAVISGANVVIANAETGVSIKLVTNETGSYQAPLLPPGTYKVEVDHPGFKRFVREGVELQVAGRLQVDAKLEVGNVTESMTVVEGAPLLETADSSIGQVVDHRRLAELPIAHGNPYALISLAPGAAFEQNPKLNRPYEATHIVGYSMAGARNNTSDITLDGVANTAVTTGTGNNNTITAAYVPPTDAVAEFKVQPLTADARAGQSSGGIINIVTKSGTNTPHGTGYWTKMTPGMFANDFFSNAQNLPPSDFNYDRWGASLNGPVYLPKVYDGRNKTFFMWAYEGIHESRPRPASNPITVPTTAERTGDFSELLALGSTYQLYNPFTRRAEGSRYRSDPFPGNLIPASLINPVSQKVLSAIPGPITEGRLGHLENFPTTNQPEVITYYTDIARVDHNFGDKNRFFVRGNVSKRQSLANDWFNSDASGQNQSYMARGGSVDDVHMFSPSFLLNLRYGYTRYVRLTSPLRGRGFDLTSLGFPAAYNNAIDPAAREFPYFQIRNNGTTILPTNNIGEDRNIDTHAFVAAFTKTKGAHSFDFGHEFRAYRYNRYVQTTTQSGIFDFSGVLTRGPLDNAAFAPMGNGFASFLLGLPDNVSSNIPTSGLQRNTSFADQSTAWIFYLQDNWRVSPKLNVTLGVRYELEGPMTERYNRSVRGFDPAAVQPQNAAVQAAYAKIALAEMPASQFGIHGGLLFAGVNGQPRTLWERIATNVMPRIGFAYTLNPKTVVRGGYSVFFSPLGIRRSDVLQNGFSKFNQLSVTNAANIIASLSNPMPGFSGGIQEPTGSSLGVLTNLGENTNFFNTNPSAPYMQRWQLSIQREILPKTVLEVAYVGNRGTRLETETVTGTGFNPTVNVNAFPNQYLSASAVRDADNNTNNSYWTGTIANPFYGVPNMGTFGTQSTIRRSTFVLAYPQFGTMQTTNNQGYSWYHSLQVRLERRYVAGLTTNIAYAWSKFMEAVDYLNAGDSMPSKNLASQDHTHRIVVSTIYEIPVGKNRKFLTGANRALDAVAGGWQLQGIYTYQAGSPLSWPDVTMWTNGSDVALSDRNPERWFNTSAFLTTSTMQPQNHLRTFPFRLSSVRADGINKWDLSAIKKFQIVEKFSVQFRAEALNALNHTRFAAPTMDAYSSSFGRVSSTQDYSRQIQLSVKAVF